MASIVRNMSQQEQLNFLLTNRIPRRYLTRLMGWYSKIESRALTRLSLVIWKHFAADLDLTEAKHSTFRSLHDCFIRELKSGARQVDTDLHTITCPCDAIVGECGPITGTQVFQAKGFPYELAELIPDKTLQEKYRDGIYVTLRLKSSMYHRFHAPIDCRVTHIDYISGDTWNVNPVALKRIEKLFCKNERAVVELVLGDEVDDAHQKSITLVPVAAILVASMKFHCLDTELDLQYRGPNRLPCDAQYRKGDEMGYFQHGSTIILFATSHYRLHDSVSTGNRIFMGQALLTDNDISNRQPTKEG
ncbi:MAG: archaetidylserine decarboxylase [Gammaproteobacteria bacterium]|nr:archaetidylserine decarboxylase [Gammaproteobacteria bacterium]